MNRVRILLSIAAAACGLPAVSGAGPLPDSLSTCMAEREDSRRLECFDRETARLAQGSDTSRPAQAVPAAPAAVTAAAASAAAPAVAPATPVTPSPAVEPTPEEKFGYRGNLARADLDEQKAAQTFDELTAVITKLSTQPRGEMVVTLDNGQVWQQKSADRPLRLAIGEKVTIRKATLGSFLLSSANSRGAMRVVRVQ